MPDVGSTLKFAGIVCSAALLLGLQACMASDGSLPAKDALARSASALSGSASYAFTGELSLYDTAGLIGSRSAFEGNVTEHGNLKLQWNNTFVASADKEVSRHATAYRPLQLLETFRGNDTVISYSDKPVPAQPVRLKIQLKEEVAKLRVANGLRDEFAQLRGEFLQRSGTATQTKKILDDANRRLEAMLSTLAVKTVCYWTADSRSWFPTQMKEETVLSYEWEGKTFQEKRNSETNFRRNADGGTIQSK